MMEGGRGSFGSDVAMMHSNHHASFQNMVATYGQHGADNLSLWLTNAKEAAAKITEATRARQKQKQEKYSKFLRDLHSRVVVSTKDKPLSKIPSARQCHLHHAKVGSDCNLGSSKHNGTTVGEGEKDLGPRKLFQQVPKMDKVRAYLEKELCKNSKGQHAISKLHRECMLQALMKEKAIEPLEEKACIVRNLRERCKSAASKQSDCIVPKPSTKAFFVPLLPTHTTAQMRDVVISEPSTPTGWNMIPSSFSALEMRSLESATSLTASDSREIDDVSNKSSQVLCPKENSKHLHAESHWVRLPGRSQSSVSRSCRDKNNNLRGKENFRSNTSLGNLIVNESIQGLMKGSPAKVLHCQRQSDCDHSVSSPSPSLSSEGVTTCSMGVVVLKDREEYENRGQGKQFFSDVWKCTMEVERRCAHERAHSLHILEKKRLDQQKAEKRHKEDLLRAKSIAKQREAVQMQLKNVAALKARRESIIQHHRSVEKKRFWNKGRYKENQTILDHVEDCEIEGSDSDLTSTQQLLCSDTSKTWLKLQALHKQQYLNILAERKWIRP